MPVRETQLITDSYYHVYNRCSHGLHPFDDKRCAIEIIKSLTYYTQLKPPVRLSFRDKLPKKKLIDDYQNRLVDILAYCVMPNHFHLLLKQKIDDGISTYMRRFQSSISHYYNRQNNQKGSLFQDRFKARLIESENDLLHVSRYIHLNPTSAKLVKTPLDYPYSSLKYYAINSFPLPIIANDILHGRETTNTYIKFVFDNILYQAELQKIKHELIDEEL